MEQEDEYPPPDIVIPRHGDSVTWPDLSSWRVAIPRVMARFDVGSPGRRCFVYIVDVRRLDVQQGTATLFGTCPFLFGRLLNSLSLFRFLSLSLLYCFFTVSLLRQAVAVSVRAIAIAHSGVEFRLVSWCCSLQDVYVGRRGVEMIPVLRMAMLFNVP